jgi:23S rRNA (pseudouridine1915-N3)-methyltransferase
MKCHIFAVGQKMPKWCLQACEEYLTRLQRFMKCTVVEIPSAIRHKAGNVADYKEEEGMRILQKVQADDHFIALDVAGISWSSEKLSENLATWQQSGKNLAFVIGGPDGLSAKCLSKANHRWSLSALTFAHPLVRVLLLEQLYRATSILSNHPYHRA